MKLILRFCFFIACSFQPYSYTESSFSHKDKYNFQDILLVVHYNHPFYGSRNFIKKLYVDFPNIVFYGEKVCEEEPSAVIQVSTQTGFFFSRVVADALNRFPNYRGYLFLQDDVLMNYWHFTRLDKDKIWFDPSVCKGKDPIPPSWSSSFDKKEIRAQLPIPRPGWFWWPLPCGEQALKKALPLLKKSDWSMLKKNIGDKDGLGCLCDMFYIPHKFRKKGIRLGQVFENVFCEIAVPTMLACFDEFEHWEFLRGHWGFEIGPGEYPSQSFLELSDWVHPLKFSRVLERDFAQRVVRAHIPTQSEQKR